MKNSGFTMLELVFVIVVVGILAASIIPQLERDNLGEAAHQVARHIRLAQHHALIEDMFEHSDVDWIKKMWRIRFQKSGNKQCYVVFADRNKLGNASLDEVAIDPLTRRPIYANSTCKEDHDYDTDTLLWKQYSVVDLKLKRGCASRKHIAFDHFGRPLQIINNKVELLQDDCLIEINTSSKHNAEIMIYQETGFTKVVRIDGVLLP
jgi:prepilin-type N-terminal cleavage/methylation domain-containing protein